MATLTLHIPTPSGTSVTPEAADAVSRLAESVFEDLRDELDRSLAPFVESWSVLADEGAPDAQAGLEALIGQVCVRVALRGLARSDREPDLPTWRVPEADAHHARWAEIAQGLHDRFPGAFFVSGEGDESATDDEGGTLDPWPDDGDLPEDPDIPEAPEVEERERRFEPVIEPKEGKLLEGFLGFTLKIPIPGWVLEAGLLAGLGAAAGALLAQVLGGVLGGLWTGWVVIGAVVVALVAYALWHGVKAVWNALKKALGGGRKRPGATHDTVREGPDDTVREGPESGIIWIPPFLRLMPPLSIVVAEPLVAHGLTAASYRYEQRR